MRIGKGIDDLLQANGRPRIRMYQRAPAAVGNRRPPLRTQEPGATTGGRNLREVRASTSNAIHAFTSRPTEPRRASSPMAWSWRLSTNTGWGASHDP